MLMHTRGMLIMTPESAMVLTGKQALDYSGGVSAEDNFGIGGYERIMGPNGRRSTGRETRDACRVLLSYYEHTYVAPGERFPRRRSPRIRLTRRPRGAACRGLGPVRIGDVFSDTPTGSQEAVRYPLGDARGDRQRPPAARALGGDARRGDRGRLGRPLGGWPVSLIGIEALRSRAMARSRPTGRSSGRPGRCSRARRRRSPGRSTRRRAGGRSSCWRTSLVSMGRPSRCASGSSSSAPRSAGRSSTARADRVLRRSRYHGGAFVVFSQKLNPNLETVALEGAHASVIGGAPAAAVVFAREVEEAAAPTSGSRCSTARSQTPTVPSACGCGRAGGAVDRRPRAEAQGVR